MGRPPYTSVAVLMVSLFDEQMTLSRRMNGLWRRRNASSATLTFGTPRRAARRSRAIRGATSRAYAGSQADAVRPPFVATFIVGCDLFRKDSTRADKRKKRADRKRQEKKKKKEELKRLKELKKEEIKARVQQLEALTGVTGVSVSNSSRTVRRLAASRVAHRFLG